MKRMKVILGLIALFLIGAVDLSATRIDVVVSEVDAEESQKGIGAMGVFVIKPASEGSVPALRVQRPAGVQSRIGAVSATEKKVLVVMQYDELDLRLLEYNREGESWASPSVNVVCRLGGLLAQALSSVEIVSAEEIVLRFRSGASVYYGSGDWAQELIKPIKPTGEVMVTETYRRLGSGEWVLAGGSHPKRRDRKPIPSASFDSTTGTIIREAQLSSNYVEPDEARNEPHPGRSISAESQRPLSIYQLSHLVISGVAALPLLGLLCYLFWRRRKGKTDS